MISRAILAFALGAPSDPLYPSWAQTALRLEEAWTVTTGSHAYVIAHLDTGWAHHVDLGINVVGEANMIADAPPTDTLGHGTAILSILAANTDNGIGVAGTAPDAGVLVIKASSGGMTQGTATDALREALRDNRVRVFLVEAQAAGWNSSQWRSALRRAARKGTVICAAGNASGHVPYPDDPDLIVVAGSNQDGTRWAYSNFGTACDIAAPSAGTMAYFADGNGDGLIDDYYGGSGTSVAAAYVAGVAALVYAANPGISPSEAKAKLLGPEQPNSWIRHGVLDAYAAVTR